jgi:hypothetical protein
MHDIRLLLPARRGAAIHLPGANSVNPPFYLLRLFFHSAFHGVAPSIFRPGPWQKYLFTFQVFQSPSVKNYSVSHNSITIDFLRPTIISNMTGLGESEY